MMKDDRSSAPRETVQETVKTGHPLLITLS
jgi:hypothetical protein